VTSLRCFRPQRGPRGRIPAESLCYPPARLAVPRTHRPVKIAILGAGVSGLALARFLVEGGLAADSISLFEAGPRVGGLCRSKTVEGYIQ